MVHVRSLYRASVLGARGLCYLSTHLNYVGFAKRQGVQFL